MREHGIPRVRVCCASCGREFRNPSALRNHSGRCQERKSSPWLDHLSDETRNRISASMSNNPLVSGRDKSSEQKKEISESNLLYWDDPVNKRRHGELLKERFKTRSTINIGRYDRTDDHKSKISTAMKKVMSNPSRRDYQSKVARDKWKDPDYVERMKRLSGRRPNGIEGFFLCILNSWFFGKFEYTGDFSFWIGGKNPDFVSFEHNIVIELFGEYWHRGENPSDIIEHYRKHGWRSLVFWSKELRYNNLGNVLSKVFHAVSENNNLIGDKTTCLTAEVTEKCPSPVSEGDKGYG